MRRMTSASSSRTSKNSPLDDVSKRLQRQFPITDELIEFAEHHHADPQKVSMLLTIPRYLRVGYEFSRPDQILELEFTTLLESDVRFRTCQRCGRYFIMKPKKAEGQKCGAVKGRRQGCILAGGF